MFAERGEEWRFDAMLDLQQHFSSDWNMDRERTFGTLLGYTEHQNDVWITYLNASGNQTWVR